MSPTHSTDLRSLRRQVAALQQRVSSIERVLTPKGEQSKRAVLTAQFDRRQAERTARREAMQEFWKQREIDRYRQFPHLLKIAREQERSINAFLRNRGIRPEKSDLAKVAKLLTQESKNENAENARGKGRAAAKSASKDGR